MKTYTEFANVASMYSALGELIAAGHGEADVRLAATRIVNSDRPKRLEIVVAEGDQFEIEVDADPAYPETTLVTISAFEPVPPLAVRVAHAAIWGAELRARLDELRGKEAE